MKLNLNIVKINPFWLSIDWSLAISYLFNSITFVLYQMFPYLPQISAFYMHNLTFKNLTIYPHCMPQLYPHIHQVILSIPAIYYLNQFYSLLSQSLLYLMVISSAPRFLELLGYSLYPIFIPFIFISPCCCYPLKRLLLPSKKLLKIFLFLQKAVFK